jgi:hypothetical protein
MEKIQQNNYTHCNIPQSEKCTPRLDKWKLIFLRFEMAIETSLLRNQVPDS